MSHLQIIPAGIGFRHRALMVAVLALALTLQIPTMGKAGDNQGGSSSIDRFAFAGRFLLLQRTSVVPDAMSVWQLPGRRESAGDDSKGLKIDGDEEQIKAVAGDAGSVPTGKGDSALPISAVVLPSSVPVTTRVDGQRAGQEKLQNSGNADGGPSTSEIGSSTVESQSLSPMSVAAHASVLPTRGEDNIQTGRSSQHAPEEAGVMPSGDEGRGGVASQRRVEQRPRAASGDRLRVRADKSARGRQPVKRAKAGAEVQAAESAFPRWAVNALGN